MPPSPYAPPWLAFDREHIWHPYTSMRDPGPVHPVVSAKGVRITLADGTDLIDGMSSWWSTLHGYNHPALNRAAHEQLAAMSHVMFGGLTHEPAVRLARRLLDITPAPLERVFFCDSGSVSVEVAIKMALQYWQARAEPGRCRLLSLRGAYHGDTTGCMAVCDPEQGMHQLFSGLLPSQVFVSRPESPFYEPFDPTSLAPMRQAISEHRDQLAAVILEPIVQNVGGMYFYHPDYLAGVRSLCDEAGLLLICDEIATGFGRTGRLFGVEHAGIAPDIMCLGKALTGGYLSLAATLCTAEVADRISDGPGGGALMHGPTFMANPLACAVADASLALLADDPGLARVLSIERQLQAELAPLRGHPKVADVRVLGGIGVLERVEPIDAAAAHRKTAELGVWLRPFGRLVYTMPPYTIEPADLSRVCQALAVLAAL